jgi:hypothetical protein
LQDQAFEDQNLRCPDCAELRRQKESKGNRTMLRKLIPAAAILALAAAPAAAQVALSPFKSQEKKLTPDELKAKQDQERDYKAAMDKIPEKKVTVDPWGDIRPAPAPQATAKNKQ